MVTRLATAMVSQWGMSDKLGNINYTSTQESFLGSQSQFNASDESREIIDQEVRRLVDEAFDRAKGILKDNWDEMEHLAAGPAGIRDPDRRGHDAGDPRRKAEVGQ